MLAGAGLPSAMRAAASSRSRPATSTASRPSDAAARARADPPAPVGEYAMSCLGRERMFEHFSRTRWHTPSRILRLNYATRCATACSSISRAGSSGARRSICDGPLQRDLAGRRQRDGARARSRMPRRRRSSSTSPGRENLSVRDVCLSSARVMGGDGDVHRAARRATRC